jgi:hypothetical protein
MDIDYELISDARRLITGANVHTVLTWIYCYENLTPGRRLQIARARASLAILSCRKVRLKSEGINRNVERLLKKSSD